MDRKLQFFLGKGGVGKSTLSVLKAMHLARQEKSVLLISMDPAHNLADIFQIKLSGRPKTIRPNLKVIETDHRKWARQFLRTAENSIKESYRYLTAVNLDKYFDLLRFSPGIEEYALLLAFDDYYARYGSDHAHIIVDMPPTALALRFFNLPSVSLLWLNKLLNLRKDIIDKKELITKIKILEKEIETDRILKNLHQQIARYETIQTILRNGELTEINLVINPESLSLNEATEIRDVISGLGIHSGYLYLNKLSAKSAGKHSRAMFRDYSEKEIPLSEQDLIGLENLDSFLAAHYNLF